MIIAWEQIPLSLHFYQRTFSEVTSDNTLGMWLSSKVDVDGLRIQPSRDLSSDHHGIRPPMDTSTYQHRDVGYGHSSQQHNAQGVQHHFITPGQRRHVTPLIFVALSAIIWYLQYLFNSCAFFFFFYLRGNNPVPLSWNRLNRGLVI